jgi:thiopurine S-methyltransferase
MEELVSQEDFWTARYEQGLTGWDLGAPSTPLKVYIDQIEDKETKILIPGAGNGHEAEYLFKKGFRNVFVLDISLKPLQALKNRAPHYPVENLIHGDFFKHKGAYDLILEQTFFCSFEPTIENRMAYAKQVAELLEKDGLLVGLWFKHAIIPGESARPFGGSKEEYLGYLSPYFEVNTFEDCYNSIRPRAGNELFGIFKKRKEHGKAI